MIEVLKQMIEALETRICSCCYESEICCAPAIKNAIQAGRQAITELESQKPVTLPCCGYRDASAVKWNPFNDVVQCHNCGQTYTPPPQRTWVGLTNNELQPIADEYRILFGSWVEDFARAIEAKLKEKNT